MSIKTIMAALLGPALLSAFTYAHHIEPEAVEIAPLRVKLPRLDPAFDGYRLVHISDIHMSRWMTGARLSEIIALINAQQPDLVAITGDFATNFAPFPAADLVAALQELRPRDAVVAVLGNHDHRHRAGPNAVRRALRESGITVLDNRVHTLRRGAAMLHIAGVDDVVFQQARLDLVLQQLPEDGAAILLAHEPDFADISAATGRFGLQLSGHTHGGQVILPLLGPPVLPKYGQRYPVGRYKVNGMIQYTNRGLGVGSLRVRFNCRPEITVFTLEAEKKP